MANVKILDLSDLTSPTSSDVLPIVDVSASITKRTTLGRLLQTASNGTAASPSISFDSDPDIGFYRISSNKIGITVSGNYRVGIDTGGINVGGGDINTPNLELRTDGDVICKTINATDDISVDRTAQNNVCFRARLNGVTTFNVAANGNTQFAGSVSIGGTAAQNTISSYEQGTWSPVLEEAGGNTFSGAAQGTYVRFGDQVVGSLSIRYDASSNIADGSQIVKITGFPYSPSSASPAKEIPFLIDNRNNSNTNFAAYGSGTTGYRGVIYNGEIRLFNLETGAPITWANVKTPNTGPTTGFKGVFTIVTLN